MNQLERHQVGAFPYLARDANPGHANLVLAMPVIMLFSLYCLLFLRIIVVFNDPASLSFVSLPTLLAKYPHFLKLSRNKRLDSTQSRNMLSTCAFHYNHVEALYDEHFCGYRTIVVDTSHICYGVLHFGHRAVTVQNISRGELPRFSSFFVHLERTSFTLC